MATLKVKIQEDIILDNQNYGSKRTLEIGSITDIIKRIVTVPASTDTTVLMFTSTTGVVDGALDIELVKYIRVTNLDGTAALQVGLDDGASDAAYTSVAANSSIMYTGVTCEGGNDGTTLDDATALKVKGIADHQIEVFIASV